MSKVRNSPTISYMIELTFSILFFTLCSVVCLMLFYHATLLNKEGTMRKESTIFAQNYMEEAMYQEIPLEEGTWYLDENFKKCNYKSSIVLSVDKMDSIYQCNTYVMKIEYKEKELNSFEFAIFVEEG